MNAPTGRRSVPVESAWVDIEDEATWNAAVSAANADVFHAAWFHDLARIRGEGTPRLFVVRSTNALVVVPLLLRPIPGTDDYDATSVYGYVGPASSGSGTQADVAAFQRALRSALARERVISVFSRLHPLSGETAWLDGLGATVEDGTTVSIAVDVPPAQRRAAYRGSHRREIARLRREGYTVHGEDGSIDLFHELYSAAMIRLGAGSRYAFTPDHLRGLIERGAMRLLVVRKDDDVACAGLFTRGGPGSHYFLSGTDPAHRRMAPSKLMIDSACDWARSVGARWMHLGGGVGGACDSLFRFKAGFSDRRHRFQTWRWIVDPHAYEQRCQAAGVSADGSFFPAYRG